MLVMRGPYSRFEAPTTEAAVLDRTKADTPYQWEHLESLTASGKWIFKAHIRSRKQLWKVQGRQ